MLLLSRWRVGDNKCVGLRTGAGIDRIGLGIRCRSPFAVPPGAAGASIPGTTGNHEPSSLKREALRHFDGDGLLGTGPKWRVSR